MWASLCYDQNMNLNICISISVDITGARIFRIIFGSSQARTGVLITWSGLPEQELYWKFHKLWLVLLSTRKFYLYSMKLRSFLGSTLNRPLPSWNLNLGIKILVGITGTIILRITSGSCLLGWEFWLQLRLWLSIPFPVLALPPNKVKLFYW